MTSFQGLPAQEVPLMAEVVADSFNIPSQRCELWVERSGLEHWRCLKDDNGAILAGLLRIPMAQRFGGQPVSMTGLAGVAVSALGRGRRLGQTLMKETLQEMRREGTALSALYGSTTSFYRKCGYERAGARMMAEIPLRELPSRGGDLEVRPLSEKDHSDIEALQAAHVQEHGSLVRGPYLWTRVRGPRGVEAQGYGFYRNGVLEGYTYLVKELRSLQDNTLEASDLVLTTAEALSSFLGLLAGHRALFTKFRWPSFPDSPILLAMPEPWQIQMTLEEHWLLRIVSLPEALTRRGYPAHLQSELHLDIDDPWFPENSGRWVVAVSGGQASIEPGGNGALQLDIGTLASLYSGFLSAEKLALAGRAHGTKESLATASRIFGGQAPQLLDFF